MLIDEESYDIALEEIETLMDLDENLNEKQIRRLHELVDLVEEYEEEMGFIA